MNTSKT